MFMTGRQQSQGKPIHVATGSTNSSRALEWLWQQLHDVAHPHLLDCGPVIETTVQVLLRRGAKIYVSDLISPLQQGDPSFWNPGQKIPVFRPEVVLAQLPEIPPASLSATFCWQLFDLLPREVLRTIVDRLFEYLQPGGVLFCLLREPYLSGGAEATWSFENLTTLAAAELDSRPFPYPALTNREVERLVSPRVVKTFLARSGRREVLAVK